MPQFAANLSRLFAELPLLERFAAARMAGFEGVEVLYPYDDPIPAIVDQMVWHKLQMVLINCPPPNYVDRPRGFAAVPGREALFRKDFARALRVAQALGAQHLHIMAGVASGAEARALYVENLIWAATQAPNQSLTIEPINSHDMPGYFLNDFDLALAVLDDVGAPNLHLQFDAYHAHRITGNVLDTWDRTKDRVAHIQVAGFPGRHEPLAGEIDYPAFFTRLADDGYDGWISGEYDPLSTTDEGMGWIS